jgi:hypothetical protein
MNIYQKPSLEKAKLDSLFFQSQGTGILVCEGDCDGALGAQCQSPDDIVAEIFIPGGDPSIEPVCVATGGDDTSSVCNVFPGNADCEGGANWFLECNGDAICESPGDIVTISCEGFQEVTCDLLQTRG